MSVIISFQAEQKIVVSCCFKAKISVTLLFV
jgi:hypothetical protein